MSWLKIGLSFFLSFLLIYGLKIFLRKVFKIEKEEKSVFSYNHINGLHKKVDWIIRNVSMIVSLVVIYLVIFKEFPIILYLVLVAVFITAEYLVRAFFEWKYSQNPKQAILTIAEILSIAIALIVVFYFDLFNIFTN